MRNIKEFKEYVDPVELYVRTRCPEKWLLVDKQTGEIYTGNPAGYWDRLEPVIKEINNELL